MNNFTMGLPANYISNPLYQQYAQMIANSARMTQAMFAQQMQRQQAAYEQQYAQQQAQLEAAQKAAEQEAIAAQQAAQAEQFAKAAEAKALSGAEDGCNDGKISFGSKLKNLGKGVVNFFKGMVCDENGKFSLKRTLTTAAIAAGAVVLTAATGGAAAPFLVAAGATLGAVEIGKGAYKAYTAKTDAEAEAAWQSIGSGTTAVVGSVIGAKSALKSAKVDVSAFKGIKGAVKATGHTFKYAYDATKAGVEYAKINGITNSVSTAAKTMSTNLKTGWESAFKSTNAKDNVKSQMHAKYDAKLAKNEAKTENLLKEIAKLEKNITKNGPKIIEKKRELVELLNQKSVIESQKANIPEFTRRGLRSKQLKSLEANKKLYEGYIKTTNDKALKATFQAKLDNIKTSIAEVEKFAQIEKAQSAIANAKTKLPQYEAKLQQINNSIEYVKNNVGLTAEQKAVALTNLAKEQATVTKLLNTAKTQINKGKRSLHWSNAKIFEAANRKSIGYPTIAITGGGVTTPTQFNPADVYAQAYGYSSAEEMQAALDAQGSQIAQATSQAQAQQNNVTTTNPYLGYNNMMTGIQPQTNNLGFNDLYVSPYSDYVA